MPSGSAVGPRWSPTGQDIAFVHVPEAATDAAEADGMERAIYVVEIATGKLTRLSR
jgi:Tol biopolymer transport system component